MTTINKELLEVLQQTKKDGLSYDNTGLCDIIESKLGYVGKADLSELFNSWYLSNGCWVCPIGVPNTIYKDVVQYRMVASQEEWEHRNEYLCMRWLLLCHCIEYLEEQLCLN